MLHRVALAEQDLSSAKRKDCAPVNKATWKQVEGPGFSNGGDPRILAVAKALFLTITVQRRSTCGGTINLFY